MRVGDDAGAGLHVGVLAVAHRDGPNRDAEIEIAGKVEIADGAAVEPAPRRLEPADDLHRANLRRAGQRAGRERRDERVEPVAVLGELALDARHEMHHVRVALERHELRHADAADLGDAADVVAAEVDEHDVLGALLLVPPQLLGQPLILVGRRAAAARAGNRMRLDVPAFDAHEHLRRGADDGLLAHADEEHVRRRVDVPQRAVDVERRRGRRRVEALRQHGLVDLAGGDVFLNLPHRAFERLARLVGGHCRAAARSRAFGAREVALQLALEEVDLRAGEVVERAQIFARPQPRVGNREDPMLDVIERQDRVEDHEAGLVAVGRRLVQRARRGSNHSAAS